ncbi:MULTISPECIES: NADH-quinone oxidoreductase subunit C [Cryobacterium]|uniref:Formate hydrogenase n=1 Tax=Cryobacterium breve TaxID=1259258 RepID=A0ABY2J9R1_9MICO|nr:MULTISPECIES: NADH-quinone oxidoreductase subunit C [Cryobacterium]TFC97833.1 formate hydrogenase [Cryobacterium sp. TmT3-12]TFD01580.1 formate hydrogenase [Cryobacterium breve]
MTNPSPLSAASPEVRTLSRDELRDEVATLLTEGNRLALVACHDDGHRLRVVYSFVAVYPRRQIDLVVPVPYDDAWIPSLADLSFPAGNFERGTRDLFGVRPANHPQPYRLVRHGHWPRGWYPMRKDARVTPEFEPDVESFPFVEVEGPGVYEIAVGPIHAGIIDPGHFRFSVVGETIVRMEARQWYMHRGVERLFEGRSPSEGIALAEQIAGDTVIGHTLTYLMAIEAASGIEVSEPDRMLRALLLELERLYNHVSDLGSLANDVGFSVVNSHAQRLRETLLRLNKAVTGHRFLRGALSVGGVSVLTLPDPDVLRAVAADVQEIIAITLGHAIVRDRFTGTAPLPTSQAEAMGTLGYVARASGIDADARRDHPFVDLGKHFHVVTDTGGDVLSRYRVRAGEFEVSIAVAIDLIRRLGAHRGGAAAAAGSPWPAPSSTDAYSGLALVEGWRGTICHRVELHQDGTVSRLKVVDPSYFNWPALPVALAETIVPDFPLVNKSFNQSYAGNDL